MRESGVIGVVPSACSEVYDHPAPGGHAYRWSTHTDTRRRRVDGLVSRGVCGGTWKRGVCVLTCRESNTRRDMSSSDGERGERVKSVVEEGGSR